MSGQEDTAERSHEPTPRKLDRARRKGDLPRSADLNNAAAYAAMLAVLLGAGASGLGAFAGGLTRLAEAPVALSDEVFAGGGSALMAGLVGRTFSATLPWFALPAAAVFAALLAQHAIVLAPEKLRPRLSRISPLANAKSKYGRAGLFEFVKSAVKLGLYSTCLGIFLLRHRQEMAGALLLDPVVGIALLARLSGQFFAVVVAIAAALGAIDYLWQRAEHLRRNRMTDREMRDELKDSEGDPHLKQTRRHRAQEIALNKMMAEVPRADVVIVNPTHFAVALTWRRTPGTAPVVVAKGVDEVARRIREAAHDARVPVYSDPPTARALYHRTEIGVEIAPADYRAVAAAIRFADMLRRKRRARGFGA